MAELIQNMQHVQCLVNVQHNCIDRNCTSNRTVTVYQEREKIPERSLGIVHQHSNNPAQPNWILNTSQMRNAHFLEPFIPALPSLKRNVIIYAAAKKETDKTKRRRKRRAKEAQHQTRANANAESETSTWPHVSSGLPVEAPVLASYGGNSGQLSYRHSHQLYRPPVPSRLRHEVSESNFEPAIVQPPSLSTSRQTLTSVGRYGSQTTLSAPSTMLVD